MLVSQPRVEVLYHNGVFTLPAGYEGHPVDRLASTPGDNLAEFAGRLCYNSLNNVKARPTPDYHANIHATKHYSVYAHAVEVFRARSLPEHAAALLQALAGRPGVWVTAVGTEPYIKGANDPRSATVRFCVSLRAVLEWGDHGPVNTEDTSDDRRLYFGARVNVREQMLEGLKPRYPHTLGPVEPCRSYGHRYAVESARPWHDQEAWASLYVEGISRDLLQELVRHHYQTNFSVRSTRYVDESASDLVLHPALAADPANVAEAEEASMLARGAYKRVFNRLTESGVDHKTARGAARSLLPGATQTKLVFSLSRFQAKHILGLRLAQETGAADPEIVRFAQALKAALEGIGWRLDEPAK